MTFLGTDYRGIKHHLADFPGLRELLGINNAPDHSTLHIAAQHFFGAAVTDKFMTTAVTSS